MEIIGLLVIFLFVISIWWRERQRLTIKKQEQQKQQERQKQEWQEQQKRQEEKEQLKKIRCYISEEKPETVHLMIIVTEKNPVKTEKNPVKTEKNPVKTEKTLLKPIIGFPQLNLKYLWIIFFT